MHARFYIHISDYEYLLQRRTKIPVLLLYFLGHWNQCQQKNDLGRHKRLTLKEALSNAKDASHVAEPRDNESDNDYGVDLDPDNIDI